MTLTFRADSRRFFLASAFAASSVACGGGGLPLTDDEVLLDVSWNYQSEPGDMGSATPMHRSQLLASRVKNSQDSVTVHIGGDCTLEFEREAKEVCAFYTLYGCGTTKRVRAWTSRATEACVLDVDGLDGLATLGRIMDPWDNPPEPFDLWLYVTLPDGESEFLRLTESQ